MRCIAISEYDGILFNSPFSANICVIFEDYMKEIRRMVKQQGEGFWIQFVTSFRAYAANNQGLIGMSEEVAEEAFIDMLKMLTVEDKLITLALLVRSLKIMNLAILNNDWFVVMGPLRRYLTKFTKPIETVKLYFRFVTSFVVLFQRWQNTRRARGHSLQAKWIPPKQWQQPVTGNLQCRLTFEEYLKAQWGKALLKLLRLNPDKICWLNLPTVQKGKKMRKRQSKSAMPSKHENAKADVNTSKIADLNQNKHMPTDKSTQMQSNVGSSKHQSRGSSKNNSEQANSTKKTKMEAAGNYHNQQKEATCSTFENMSQSTTGTGIGCSVNMNKKHTLNKDINMHNENLASVTVPKKDSCADNTYKKLETRGKMCDKNQINVNSTRETCNSFQGETVKEKSPIETESVPSLDPSATINYNMANGTVQNETLDKVQCSPAHDGKRGDLKQEDKTDSTSLRDCSSNKEASTQQNANHSVINDKNSCNGKKDIFSRCDNRKMNGVDSNYSIQNGNSEYSNIDNINAKDIPLVNYENKNVDESIDMEIEFEEETHNVMKIKCDSPNPDVNGTTFEDVPTAQKLNEHSVKHNEIKLEKNPTEFSSETLQQQSLNMHHMDTHIGGVKTKCDNKETSKLGMSSSNCDWSNIEDKTKDKTVYNIDHSGKSGTKRKETEDAHCKRKQVKDEWCLGGDPASSFETKQGEYNKHRSTEPKSSGTSFGRPLPPPRQKQRNLLCRKCNGCNILEKYPGMYKSCKLCLIREASRPKIYCSKVCQYFDWKRCHRREHRKESYHYA